MATRIAASTLNASTVDIMNVIRANASYDYQQNVPEVTTANDIPTVGEVIYGTPAFANQFINALVNRIALVRANGANFNNPYAKLKKGYLEFGETVEDIFVNIAKVVEFDPNKSKAREFQRTYPDIRTAFHTMNYRVTYPVTIQDEDLKQAFLSTDGVQGLIGKIVDSVYTAAEYDEFLLFKYLLIKSIAHGKLTPVGVAEDDISDFGVKARGYSNLITFMKSDYNIAGVKTSTPRDRQAIFVDALFEAEYGVKVLASAFNMDEAAYLGNRYLIDDWTTFDNDRFAVIRENSTQIEEVTDDELALLADVRAVLVDEDFFQIYDNNNKFTEKYVASGLYWQYFYHVWKTVSYSPFVNALVLVDDTAAISLPDSVTVEIATKDVSDEATVFALKVDDSAVTFSSSDVLFVQTDALTTAGIAVQKYGALIIPASQADTAITLAATIKGTTYTATSTITSGSAVGDTVTLSK